MPTNKNKFNTSKNTKEWFPFAKYLFITENHPIRQSQDKCSSSIEAIFSQQELEQRTQQQVLTAKDAVVDALPQTSPEASVMHLNPIDDVDTNQGFNAVRSASRGDN